MEFIVVLCVIISILVMIVDLHVVLCHCRAKEDQLREKGCQLADLMDTWGWGGSLVVCVVVKIAIVVCSIGVVIAVVIIFIIGIIVGETGIVVVIADAITGCIVRA